MEATDELTSFIVTVGDRELIGEVVLKLEALGFEVERVMKRTGVVGGHGPGNLLGRIARLQNVKLVRADRRYQLPPLDGSIPQ